MKWIPFSRAVVAVGTVLMQAGLALAAPAFPLRASEDGRYLIDASGKPFLYHADTAWNITKKLTIDEAIVYLDDRKARGFTAIQIQAISKEQGPMANRAGHNPFDPPDDILKPNEPYWQHLDRVLDAAKERGFLVAVAPIWIRWGGTDKEGWRNQLTDDNARPYGRFLGQRYKRFDNLVWILGGDADPKEKTGAIRALAAGLKETAPHHLLTVHNAPEHASAEFFADDKWLDINMAYSYREVQPHVLAEYARKPPRPIVLGESGYEEESNDKRGGDAHRMRRQAYGALLGGAAGHAFGTKHVWRFDADWRHGLDSPASRHMTFLGRLFAERPWHRLVPDARHDLVTDGFGEPGEVDYVSAARADDRSLAMVYLPTNRPVTVDPARVAAGAAARWFDPTDGRFTDAQSTPAGNRQQFQPPAKNSAGDGDFVLVIEARAAGAADPAVPARRDGPRVTPEDAVARQEAVRAQIERYLDREIARSKKTKDDAWRRDFSSADAYEKSVEPWRQKLFDMIGGDRYPPAPPAVREELIGDFDTHRAYRVWLSVFDDMQAYGVLLVPTEPPPAGGRRPALVCVHGMSGTPESLCGLLEKPDYHKDLGARAARRGYVVFAPSNVNNYKTRSWLDRKAILVGQRMQALEQRKLMRVVDYLCSRPDVDPNRIAAYGISWGGRTVMYGAALDKRFAACAISGHFNELVPKMVTPSPNYTAFIETGEDYSFFPNNFNLMDEVDVVSMICPRPVLVEQGRQDRVVHWEMSRRAFGRVKEMYDKLGLGSRATYAIFEGGHEMHGEGALAFFDRHLK